MKTILARFGLYSFTLHSFAGLLISSFVIFGLGRVLYLVMHALMARYLGPEAYGQVNFALVNIQFLVLVADLGLSIAGMRFIAGYLAAEDWGKLRDYILFSCKIIIISSLTFAAFGGAVVWFWPMSENQAETLLTMVFLVIPMTFGWWRDFVSRGFHRPREALLPREVLYPLFTIALMFLFPIRGIFEVGLSLAGSILIAEVIGLMLLYRVVPPLSRTAGRTRMERLPWFRVSIPIMFSQLARTSIDRADLVIVGLFTDLYTLGLYAAATRIAALMTIIPRIVTPVVSPLIARSFSNHEIDQIQVLLRRAVFITALTNSPLLVLVFLFPEFALAILGDQFVEGSVFLRILALGYYGSMLFNSAAQTLLMVGQEKTHLKITITSSLANVTALVIFVPLYGGIGAATVTAAVLSAMSCAFIFSARPSRLRSRVGDSLEVNEKPKDNE